MNRVPSRKQSLSCLYLVIYPSHFKIFKNSWFPLLFLNICPVNWGSYKRDNLKPSPFTPPPPPTQSAISCLA